MQGGLELRGDLRGVWRRDTEVQGPGDYLSVRGVPLECRLQRCYAKLQHGDERLRTAAFMRGIGGDLRPERQRELLRVERGDRWHIQPRQ